MLAELAATHISPLSGAMFTVHEWLQHVVCSVLYNLVNELLKREYVVRDILQAHIQWHAYGMTDADLLCSLLLLIIVVVDAAAVLGAPVTTLLVEGGGVHMLEEAV